MKHIVALLSLVLLMGCSPRTTYLETPTSTPPTRMTAADVKKGILDGCAERGWTATDIGSTEIAAQITVRGKHTVKIKIPYNARQYTIQYVGSENMKYTVNKKGQQIIHRNYNNWVLNLKKSIDSHLMKNLSQKLT